MYGGVSAVKLLNGGSVAAMAPPRIFGPTTRFSSKARLIVSYRFRSYLAFLTRRTNLATTVSVK